MVTIPDTGPIPGPDRTLRGNALKVAVDKLLKAMPTAVIEDAKIGCATCGQDHVWRGKRTCNAHSRRATPLRPCRKFPIRGLTVCRFHGGAAPQVAKKAEARIIERQRRMLETQLLSAVDAQLAAVPGPVLLPDPRPLIKKKGGHKDPNSWSARRPRFRPVTYPRDEGFDRDETSSQ